ncbi:MAG: SUMF1/EgtB/PvdO family nonheme iron enzyme [bacterium]|nr:SUMF1/EgtB/PvdO family nonheme iron enzyme [bacterium]
MFVLCGDTGERVLRGGSWNNNEDNLRSANRNRNNPDNRNNNNGFRCSRSCAHAVSRMFTDMRAA